MRCPTCRKEVTERIKGIWPFCSKRCKMVDLGKWAKEEYRIAGKPSAEDAEEIVRQLEEEHRDEN